MHFGSRSKSNSRGNERETKGRFRAKSGLPRRGYPVATIARGCSLVNGR